MTSPRRRWFRFSLRTLFVLVTALAVALGWVAYQLDWMRERQGIIAASAANYSEPGDIHICRNGHPLAPWQLHLFGEEGYEGFFVAFGQTDPRTTRIRVLFPEAWVYAQADESYSPAERP